MARAVAYGIAFFVVLALASSAATIYVPDNHPTIQDAINVAVDGDVVIVRPGTYKELVSFLGKGILLTSEHGPDYTVIDGRSNDSVVSFKSGEGPDAVLSGFTITNGYSAWGGGIACQDGSSPTIEGNIITANYAIVGGAIECNRSSSPTIQDNLISLNRSEYGGGIYCRHSSSATICDNTISDNSATLSGGGIWAMDYCDNKILGNRILYNTAGDLDGGGIFNDHSWPLIEGNMIVGNVARERGGGLFTENSAVLNYNVIVGNSADEGGGIWSHLSTTVASCVVASNHADSYGGGIHTHRTETIVNSTIVGNTCNSRGGGIYVKDKPILINSIVRDNSTTQIYAYGTPDVSYCNIEGGWTGTGNIDADPLFADAANGDYHLTVGSPCMESGNRSAPGADGTDMEGDPRTHGFAPDMGADEFYKHLYHVGTVEPGNTLVLKVAGPPGVSCTLGYSATLRETPLSTTYGDLWLEFPLIRTSLGVIPTDGILVYQTTAPGFWQPGEVRPLQALIGPVGNPGSTLTNLNVLEVE